jgi:L-lactate dehydrogenase complex protein LldE
MRVGLMIPCYVDVFYPEVGIAALELLEKLGVEVEYPFDQTCCGQPMANSGCEADARATEELFIRNFSAFEYIVSPSGSCTHHIRNKFIAAPPSPERDHVQSHVYDLVEFLHDVVKAKEFPWATFPHKVALHTSCSAIRGLFMQSMSERVHDHKFSKPKNLLLTDETFHEWYRKHRLT